MLTIEKGGLGRTANKHKRNEINKFININKHSQSKGVKEKHNNNSNEMV